MGSENLQNWRFAKLGDIADVNWGDTSVTKASYTSSGFPAYSAKGPDGFLPYADYNKTAIVVSAIGAQCGRTWLAKGKWSCIKNTLRFWATDPSVDTEFLYWATKDVNLWPKRGSAQPFIAQQDARSLIVLLPPLPEQRAIAHILGTLDDKIETLRRMNETLEGLARALFKAWFVDFEPVRAKMSGRWRRGQSLPGLPADLYDLFPDRLVPSELGEIPAGWAVHPLKVLASLNPSSWTKRNPPSVIKYVDLSNTKWGKIEKIVAYSWENAPSRARRILKYGDTIIGTVRPANGSYALIGEDGLTGSTGFAVLRPQKEIFREFVFLAATSEENIERLAHVADGAAYPAIRPEVVAETRVVFGNAYFIERFHAISAKWIDKMLHNESQTRTLAALRDALLPELVSGRLRVKDAEKFLQARGIQP